MKFLYVGRFMLLESAASIRVYNIGKILKSCGHEVDYLCQEGYAENGETVFDGSRYISVLREGCAKKEMAAEWLFGKLAFKMASELLNTKEYDGVILYNLPFTTFKKISRFCKKNKISVFCDVTEWYSRSLSNGIFASVNAMLVDRRIRKYDKTAGGVIAISNYLYSYYKKRVNTVEIPPVFFYKAQQNTSKNSELKFIYAGSPSKKDELMTFISAVKELNIQKECKRKITLTLIGAPIPDGTVNGENGITYLPRMSNGDVISNILKCDFTVLLRRDQRYAKAGYSTKVAESLYNGTPVFCNEIGGADTDIKDGVNGVKISELSKDAIKQKIKWLASLSDEQILLMKQNAYEQGKERYSAERYFERLEEFIK